MGSYPRGDVNSAWAKDGRPRRGAAVISIRGDGGVERVGEVVLGPGKDDPVALDVETGTKILIDIRGQFGLEHFHRQVTFVLTGDQNALYVAAVGPGAKVERRNGLLRRRVYSGFEFGVLVMGASTQEGIRVPGPFDGLVDNGPWRS